MVATILLLVAVAGLVSCTGFLILLGLSFLRLRYFRKRPAATEGGLPPVALLKPLCGLEPNLEHNLESFFCQDYPRFELIFGARQANDPALELVQALEERYPSVPVKVVLAGEPDRPNAKVCLVEAMVAAAEADHLIISDSDVHVTPDYIRQVVEPLRDPDVGLVTCMYRGVPTGGFWARLEALGMSVEMTAGVMVAALLEGMRFALGPTMALRRGVLDEIGGVGALAEYCADDFVLGQKVFAAGRQVALSHYTVDHVVVNRGFRGSLQHQARWMKSTRFSRPRGHAGTGLTFAMPFGLLGLAVAVAAGQPLFGALLLGYAALNRMAEALIAGWGVVNDPLSLRYCWLYPVRDLFGFFLWCGSFFGTTIVWRGERYRLQLGGKMVRAAASAELAAKPASGTVAVDNLA